MKTALPLLCLALLAGCATPPPAAPPVQVASAETGKCLPTYFIDHTTIPDDRTILFTMRDGTVWQNTLPQACQGLSFQGGFEYVTSFDEVCSNAQEIRVLRQNSRCMLGAFTPYVAPKAP